METKTTKFINCSNHPSAKWSEAQLNAAKAYGEIIDVPFPNVAPEATTAEVHDLAFRLFQTIGGYGKVGDLIVHIMGEMTVVCDVVQQLQLAGIPCVASTTRRIAEEMPDGTKVSRFEFVQFREY